MDIAKAYLEPSRTSAMEIFCINTIFSQKSSNLDIQRFYICLWIYQTFCHRGKVGFEQKKRSRVTEISSLIQAFLRLLKNSFQVFSFILKIQFRDKYTFTI